MTINYNFGQQLMSALGVASGIYSGNYISTVKSGLEGTMGLFDSSSKNSARAAAQQYNYNLKLQQQAQEWNEYMYKNRYQMQVDDLEKAGINKLYGLGSAPSVTSGTNSVGMPDMVGEQNNKFQQLLTLANFGQELSAKRAQTRLLENQANTEAINTNLKTLETQTQELENLKRQKDLNYQDRIRINEIKESISRTKLNIANAQEAQAGTYLKYAETARTKAESGKIIRYEKWARENPKLAKIAEEMDALTQSGDTFKKMLKGGGTGLKILLNR